MTIKDFVKGINGKNIHIIGISGSEGSSILRLLCKHNIGRITGHDFISSGDLEKNFRIWHKTADLSEKNEALNLFRKDLGKIKFCDRDNYLSGISSAEVVFVPQSWRLYHQNMPLFGIRGSGIPFYSLTRLYLDYAPCRIIAVTGTVGKGSVSFLIYQILNKLGKKVHFAGNESWNIQILDQLENMTEDDFLVLEVSHRQLMDGFSKAPKYIVYTNIYPNHLDEVTFNEYIDLKMNFAAKQGASDNCIINYDNVYLRNKCSVLKSKVIYYSSNIRNMNNLNIQKNYTNILNINCEQYLDNILACVTLLDTINIDIKRVIEVIEKSHKLKARLELIGEKSGIKFFDDIKSTTPWATMSAVKKIGKNSVVIMGGETKGIDYKIPLSEIKNNCRRLLIIKSKLSGEAKRLGISGYEVFTDLEKAIYDAYKYADKNDSVVISPGASFFYSDFIKNKKSVRKIFTSLPQEAR
jgi:UDP-N-acetylmuramoylalanine--D-glutamate ligase